jgi:hypothetical protein
MKLLVLRGFLGLYGSRNYRLKDAHKAGTPAQIAGQTLANLCHSRVWVGGKKMRRGHQHAGRANSTLRSTATQKRLLQRVEFTVAREAFNRLYACALRL